MADTAAWGRDLIILCLLGWSNFLPILGRIFLKTHWATPVDFGRKWPDGRPIFGPHKTWRGLLFAVVGTSVTTLWIGYGAGVGALLAGLAMTGDLVTSFIKRRMNLVSGHRAVILDQTLECLLPMWLLRDMLDVSPVDTALVFFGFVTGHLVLSPILFKLHMRRNPF